MITLDFGQPEGARVDGVTVHKAFAPGAGLPVVRFVFPKLTAMWSALARADADIYYVRSASMWLGVVVEFCRRHGRRSVYAGASDKDFVPGVGAQLPTCATAGSTAVVLRRWMPSLRKTSSSARAASEPIGARQC